MMAGHRFMQGKRLHFPLGPRVERIRIRVKPSWPASLDRAGLVVGRGLRFLGKRGNRLHSVRQARKLAEKPGQFRVYSLGDIAIAAQQTAGVAIVELRIRSEKFGEILEAALKTGLFDD